jgi:hypothetical protein
MELITLCGLVIVVFGLWVEFDLAVKAVVKMIRNSKSIKNDFKNTAVQYPVHMSRMPICLANLPSYRQGV